MKGYKGFEPGMVCRGKKYAENTVFEEEYAVICKSGMHFCQNPFDVLDYYGLVRDDGSLNEVAEVEAIEDPKTDDGKKYCTRKLKIGAKLSFSGFIKACIDFMFENTINNMPNSYVDSRDSAVKAKKGCWITLSEWKLDDAKNRYIPVCVKTEFVDGEQIKADTWYKLKDGEFVEVE